MLRTIAEVVLDKSAESMIASVLEKRQRARE